MIFNASDRDDERGILRPLPPNGVGIAQPNFINHFAGDRDMSNLAESFEEVFAVETDRNEQLDGDVVEISPQRRESLSVNFFEELDAWARHSLGLNGFGDY